MKFSIARDSLVKSLNLVAGVVERRQTLPILANVLIVLEERRLSLTGTDLEVGTRNYAKDETSNIVSVNY